MSLGFSAGHLNIVSVPSLAFPRSDFSVRWMKYITSADDIDHLIRTYQHHLRNAKGLAPHTCAVRASQVQHFLTKQWKRASGRLTLNRLRAPHILKYVTGQGTRYRPTSLQHLASTPN